MRVVLYEGRDSPRPTPLDASWPELCELLTSFPAPRCRAPGAPPGDLPVCVGRKCPGKDGPAWSGAHVEGWREDDAVADVSVAVLDLDHAPPARLAVLLARLGFGLKVAHAVHTTHSHLAQGPEDGCYRVAVPLSRPATVDEWRRARPEVAALLGLARDAVLDPAGEDPSRFFYLPTVRAGVEPYASAADGAPLDLDALLASAGARAAADLPADAPPAPPAEGPVDLAALRECLAAARRRKLRGDDRDRGHAELLRRALAGEAIGEVGGLHRARVRLAGLLAYHLPAGTPWGAVEELLRPSLAATPVAPGDARAAAAAKTERLFGEASRARAKADAERAADAARVAEVVDKFRARPPPSGPAEVAAAGGSWEDLVLLNRDGEPRACEHNVALFLTCDPRLAGTLRWDVVRKRVEVAGGPLAGTHPDALPAAAAAWLQRHCALFAGAQLARAGVLQVALANPIDHVAEALAACAWDGVPRLDGFLSTYLGVADSPHVRAVSRRWLVSLVARALAPGCKVDTVLVLEGAEGLKKSTALSTLVGEEWFTDTPVDMSSKDGMQAVASVWLAELGELSSLRRAEVERVTTFVSSRVDKFRLPYGAAVTESPRRCVLVGTTNDEEYLKKRTGNRRWWPVRVSSPIDVAALRRDRVAILAEAVAAYRAGERWWLEGDEEEGAARAEVARRVEVAPVEELVARWWFGEPPARRPRSVTAADVAELALRVDARQLDGRLYAEVGHVMRALGFTRSPQRRVGSVRVRAYEPTAELLAAEAAPAAGRRGADLALVRDLVGGVERSKS